MFRSGMMESVDQPQESAISVVVPDSYVGFLRLLTFLYTNCLPEGANDILLDDLLTADRYNLTDMRLYCESMIRIDSGNWFDVMRAARSIDSQRLIRDVLSFLRENSSELKRASTMTSDSTSSGECGEFTYKNIAIYDFNNKSLFWSYAFRS